MRHQQLKSAEQETTRRSLRRLKYHTTVNPGCWGMPVQTGQFLKWEAFFKATLLCAVFLMVLSFQISALLTFTPALPSDVLFQLKKTQETCVSVQWKKPGQTMFSLLYCFFFFPLALHLSFLFGLSESLCVRGVLLGPQYLWQATYASKVTPPSRRGNTSHQTHHSNTIPHGPHWHFLQCIPLKLGADNQCFQLPFHRALLELNFLILKFFYSSRGSSSLARIQQS